MVSILAGIVTILGLLLKAYYSPEHQAKKEEKEKNHEEQDIREAIANGDVDRVSGAIDKLRQENHLPSGRQ